MAYFQVLEILITKQTWQTKLGQLHKVCPPNPATHNMFGLGLKLLKQKGLINKGKLVIRSACSILLLKINWLLLCLDLAAGSPWEVYLEKASGKHYKSVHSIIQKQRFAYLSAFSDVVCGPSVSVLEMKGFCFFFSTQNPRLFIFCITTTIFF